METGVGIGVGLVIGVLITLLGTYYLWVLQRRKIELGYQVLSANVLIPGPPEATPDIQVVVKNTLIDPSTPVPDAFSPVEEVLGFRVLLKNTGNEAIENQIVSIDLGDKAVTLSASFEKQPDLGHQHIEIQTQAGSPRNTTMKIPFLNPTEEIIVSLQSIRNANKDCTVSAGAPGLTYYDIGRRESSRLVLIGIGALLLIGSAFAAFIVLALAYDANEPTWAAASKWAAIGVAMGTLTLVQVFFLAWPFMRSSKRMSA